MMQQARRIGFGLFTTLAIVGFAGQAPAADERFEVSSIKAVRGTLVDTAAALQQGSIPKAKEAFEAYDSAWNGVEVYIGTRDKPMYDKIELDLQARVEKEMAQPMPDMAAEGRLAGDDRQVWTRPSRWSRRRLRSARCSTMWPRLRMVRSHLREVTPALKAGNIAKAKKSYEAFDGQWDSIEDLNKARSADAYVAIEKGMIQIEQELEPAKPDVAKATALIAEVNTQYNAALAMVAKEARATIK